MKVLLIGSEGQLGSELMERRGAVEVDAPKESDLDITDLDRTVRYIVTSHPDTVLLTAAYTAVDRAELDPDTAFAVNRDGAGHVAEGAAACGARLVFVSTDYVYPGTAFEPLSEDTAVDPLGVYGRSKLAGEEAVLEWAGEDALIVRTSSLHGSRGQNFVHTMLKLFQEREEIKVVDDQVMSPTWAGWLADALWRLCALDHGGVVHACSGGAVTWYDFAAKILELVAPSLKRLPILVPCSAAEFGAAAPRPQYSVLATNRITEWLGSAPPSWEEGLRSHLLELGYEIAGGS